MKKTVITIATGKPLYVRLAVNLAQSFYLWNKNPEIDFCIVTDQPELLPQGLISLGCAVQATKPGELAAGFSSKLFLDKLAPEGQTLFIDSDCLIFGDLSSVFERFKGMPVSVIGGYISSGEWFGDINAICKKFNVPRIPKFNGGIYYLEKGEIATAVYEKARELEKQYDQIGFVRLRNRPNDEVLMGLAMQLTGLESLKDDGTIMADPLAYPGKYQIDIVKGYTLFNNPPAHPNHRAWNTVTLAKPLIVHFLGEYTLHYPYRREVYRLSHNLSWFGNLKSVIAIEYPERLKLFLKKALRPAYKLLFGTRSVKPSERL